jgi:hypothetical protein
VAEINESRGDFVQGHVERVFQAVGDGCDVMTGCGEDVENVGGEGVKFLRDGGDGEVCCFLGFFPTLYKRRGDFGFQLRDYLVDDEGFNFTGQL